MLSFDPKCEDDPMIRSFLLRRWLLAAAVAVACLPSPTQAACCYFSAKNTDI
jgi:hypothetical protein